MGEYQHVYFDLDGTLIDHFDAIHRSFAYAGEKLGLIPASYEKVVTSVGGSVPVTASKLYPEADPAIVAELFEQHFDTVMYDQVEIHPGTKELLQALHHNGIQCIVFTNKRGDKARNICNFLKFDPWLTGIVGTGDTPFRKPQKEFSEHALRKFSAQSATSCLIGDSPYDEQAAIAVGMDCYLVATGSHTVEELKAHTRCPVFLNLTQLSAEVFNIH